MTNNNAIVSLKAGVILFLSSLPISLGISLASGAPLLAGMVSTIIGGTIVTLISKSNIVITAPLAGTTAIVLTSISKFDSFDSFLLVVLIAGVIQILIGLTKITSTILTLPQTIIHGFVSSIGVMVILKQIPHLVGYDIFDNSIQYGSIVLSAIFMILAFYNYYKFKNVFKNIWLSLLISSILYAILLHFFPILKINQEHCINVPANQDALWFLNLNGVFGVSISKISIYNLLTDSVTLAIIITIESALALRGVDFIDETKTKNIDYNREIISQGIGNALCSIFGGLPIGSAFVRTSINYYSGAKNKIPNILNSILFMLTLTFFARFVNQIPLSIIACIFIITGINLIKFKSLYRIYKSNPPRQIFTIIVTIICVQFTDLYTGVLIGFLFNTVYFYTKSKSKNKEPELYHEVIEEDKEIIDLASIGKNILKSQLIKTVVKNSMIVIFSGLITFILFNNKFLNYDDSVINHLQVFGTVFAIITLYLTNIKK